MRKAAAPKAAPKPVGPKITKSSLVHELEVFDPAYEAHKLRLAGTEWREVAIRCGYGDPVTARMAVSHFITRAALEFDAAQKREALALQLDRYEAVLKAWWERATVPATVLSSTGMPVLNGTTGAPVQMLDERAANVVLKTLAQIDRLYNFGVEDVAAKPEVIVIGGTPEQYTAGLRAVVESEARKG